MYNNSGGVTLLQNAPKAWLLWAVASPLALWLVLCRKTNRKKKGTPYIFIYIYRNQKQTSNPGHRSSGVS